VSEPFCTECNRARITADGQLFTCLFASTGLNLRPWLEPGSDPEVLCAVLRQHWRARTDRYSEERGLKSGLVPERAEMAYLGG
jgi:cyclic pyranopterin phosphate synthase